MRVYPLLNLRAGQVSGGETTIGYNLNLKSAALEIDMGHACDEMKNKPYRLCTSFSPASHFRNLILVRIFYARTCDILTYLFYTIARNRLFYFLL